MIGWGHLRREQPPGGGGRGGGRKEDEERCWMTCHVVYSCFHSCINTVSRKEYTQKINLPFIFTNPVCSLNAVSVVFFLAAARICVKAICYCDYQWEESVSVKGVCACVCVRARASDIMLRWHFPRGRSENSYCVGCLTAVLDDASELPHAGLKTDMTQTWKVVFFFVCCFFLPVCFRWQLRDGRLRQSLPCRRKLS